MDVRGTCFEGESGLMAVIPSILIKDYKTMTKKINGGFIGLDDRIKHINHALAVLAT